MLRGPAPSLPLAVALSGGADSTALLLLAVRAFPGQVRAVHIHHGLQAAADGFQRHCEALCGRLGVPLATVRVQAAHAPGESPEDAARRARYAALARAAREAGAACVWLGHHADDQAETLLLALSRGAGLPGLAAMPRRFEREGLAFERPLLAVPGPQLRRWLQAEGVPWVDDPTNADTAFTRNRIRHELLPALEAAFPQFRETFARSARHAAQAQQLLAQVAADDLQAMGGPPALASLQRLSRERQANLLRHWLRVAHGAAPSAAQLEALLDQVAACRTRGHRIHLKVASGFVLRAGDRLAYQAAV
ncbi:tRNA lysidine(34) synthetase TilS [Ramlibacter sp. MAHUQ-53]|uniref:tRNA lysidine(34) synthetase TilS n=1 Tax=unclassified Ramlibacter TaxID=2617605 RepID=UPI0036254D87